MQALVTKIKRALLGGFIGALTGVLATVILLLFGAFSEGAAVNTVLMWACFALCSIFGFGIAFVRSQPN